MEWVLIKTVLSLGAVIGLMLGVVVLLKKFVYGNRTSSSTPVEITVLGTKALQPKRSIVVVKVMNKILVVGMSEHGMHSLTQIEEDTSLNDQKTVPSVRSSSHILNHATGASRTTGAPFVEYLIASLSSFIGKRNGKSHAAAPPAVEQAGGTAPRAEQPGKVSTKRRSGRTKNHDG